MQTLGIIDAMARIANIFVLGYLGIVVLLIGLSVEQGTLGSGGSNLLGWGVTAVFVLLSVRHLWRGLDFHPRRRR